MPSKALIRQKVKGSLVSWWRLSVRVRTNLEISNPPLFSSVTQFCPTLCDLMDCSIPSFPVHHQLPELVQTHVHRVGDTIQPPHPLLSPSPPTSNLSQHQGLFQWVSSLHQVAKVLEFQLSISPSNEYSGLVSFRMDWLDLLAVQGTFKGLLQHHSSKASILQLHQYGCPIQMYTWLLEKR